MYVRCQHCHAGRIELTTNACERCHRLDADVSAWFVIALFATVLVAVGQSWLW